MADRGPGRPNRWPARVYSVGDEPDYRVSLANERTFLAWLRTSMALVAGAVALDALAGEEARGAARIVAEGLVMLGAAGTVVAWVRWSANERAMRRGEPLTGFRAGAAACAAILLVAGAAAALVPLR